MNSGKMHSITATLIFLIIISAYLVMALKFPIAYIFATYEDLVGEWAQVLVFCCVCAISIKLAFYKSKYRFFFILLAAASFYTFMEEISWGQRLLGVSTPGFFKEHNLQQETNLHNFITGPFKTEIKRVIEYLLFAGLMLYGLVFPLLWLLKNKFTRYLENKGILPPPLYLWPFFATSAFFELGLFNFNEAEIAEILIPMGLTIFLSHHLLLIQNNPSPEIGRALSGKEARRLSLVVATLFIGIVLASSAITYALYTTDGFKTKIDSRINNGIEKFGSRYKRYGLWDTAVRLYHMVDKNEPNRPSIQRKLATGYKMLGKSEKSNAYIQRAFDINVERIRKKPSSISAHISQSITYRQINDDDQSVFHLKKALNNATQRVKEKPNSGNAAYWLGKVYLEMGDNRQALTQFRKALDLNPKKKKFKKAFLKTKIRIDH